MDFLYVNVIKNCRKRQFNAPYGAVFYKVRKLWRKCTAILLIILLSSIILQYSTIVYAEEEPQNLYALSACLMDADSGRVLFEKAGYEKMAMASTTKIMTLLIALEYGNLEDTVTVSDYAASMPDVQLNIRAGERYYLKDLLFSLMLESHNDVAVAIAEHIGGSVEGFASLMNGKAYALGAFHTNFVTPNGLDAEGHYTTAVDLAKIASYAIQNEEFIKITNTKSHSFCDLTGKRQFTVNNKNAFLTMMDGAIGVKTGFTGKAGYCFVGALKQDGKTLVSVVLACGWPNNKTYKWADTKKLMNYGLNNFEEKKMTKEEIELPKLPVADGTKEFTDTALKGFEELSMLLSKDEAFSCCYELPNVLAAPVAAGSKVGTLRIMIDEECVYCCDIVAAETVPKTDYAYYAAEVWNLFLQIGNLMKKSFQIE